MDDVVAILQKNQDTLEQILVWTKIGGSEKLKKTLEGALDTPQKKLVYHFSDGRPIRDVAQESGVGIGTISGYWSARNRLGIMKIKNVKGKERSVKVFDLDDIGIDLPKQATKQEPELMAQPQAAPPAVQPATGVEEQ
ncbi:MAG: hypothetical protein ACREAZ_12085 [Nitrososphaera sp.]